jgi:hypothetical protein
MLEKKATIAIALLFLCYTVVFSTVVALRITGEIFFTEFFGFFLRGEKGFTHRTLTISTLILGHNDFEQGTWTVNLCHLELLSN